MIRTIEQRLVYENDYVRVYDDRVAFPDGHEGTYCFTRWKAPYGVGIIPVVGDRVLLIRSYRYGDGGYALQIPQGFGTSRRTPVEQAAVELEEETGLQALALKAVFELGGDYRTHVFLATLAEDARPSRARQEATEDIAGFAWFPVSDIGPSALRARGIANAITVASLLALPELL